VLNTLLLGENTMKRLTFALGLVTMTSLTFLNAAGFDVELGPFQFQLESPIPMRVENSPNRFHRGKVNNDRNMIDRPICHAIENQKQIEVSMAVREEIGAKESKITFKKVIINPYQLGINQQGQPVLQGDIVDTKIIKEISIKYGDEKYKNDDSKRRGRYSGQLRSFSKNQKNNGNEKGIDINSVRIVNVIEDSHFDIPKDIDKQLDTKNDEGIQIVCRVPSYQQKEQN
jgi:hypothetical protein